MTTKGVCGIHTIATSLFWMSFYYTFSRLDYFCSNELAITRQSIIIPSVNWITSIVLFIQLFDLFSRMRRKSFLAIDKTYNRNIVFGNGSGVILNCSFQIITQVDKYLGKAFQMMKLDLLFLHNIH